jgi:hypothetical protein
MSRPHRHDRALAAAAALDDLAPSERARWTALRGDCGVCLALELELRGVLADLALAAPGHVPPASLLDRVRTAIRADAGAWSS